MKTALLLLILSSSTISQAQEVAITWKGEVRVRGELDGRDFRNRTPMNAYTLLRTRLSAEILPTTNVQLFLQLQDARVFGQPSVTGTANTSANYRNLDLRQGSLRLDSLFHTGLSVTLGRMEMTYGNQRVIGAAEWANVGRAFDGGLLRYRWDAHSLDVFTTNVSEYNMAPTVSTPATVAGVGGEGFLFSGLYYAGTLGEKNRLDGYFLHEWSRKSAGSLESELTRATLGAYVRGSAQQVQYEAEAAYQFGDLATKTISAYLLSGTLGYTFENSPLASVSASYDFLSGSADTTKFKSFFAPFYTGHKWFGFMDYFVNIPDNTLTRGLQDMIVKIVLKPSERSTVNVWFHNFAMADKGSLSSGSFGQELDLTSSFAYNNNVSFELGVSAFLPGDFMRSTFRGSDVAWWGYAATKVWF
jgi:hypothetical protein